MNNENGNRSRRIAVLALIMTGALAAGGVHAGEAEITLKSAPRASQPAERQAPPARPSSRHGNITLKRGVVESHPSSSGNGGNAQSPDSVQAPGQAPAGLLLPAVQH